MSYKEQFFKDLGDYLGVPADVVITEVSQESYEQGGCPSCYGGFDYEISVYGIRRGKPWSKSYSGKIEDFINSLD